MNSVFGLFLILLFTISVSSQELIEFKTIDEFKSIMDSSKGKVTLVNFWATWCPPCVKEFPELVKLYNNYKDENFNLIFVSLDDNSEVKSKLIPFLKKQGVDFVSYHADLKKPEELIDYVDKSWQGEIPLTKIYDKEGKLAATFIGSKTYQQFEAEIKKILN